MILFQCKLPLPPSVNSLYGGGSGQKRFPSKKYKAWLLSCPKLQELNIDEPITVEYIFTFPDKRARDLSNMVKAPEDFLVNSKVIKDDNYNIVTKILLRHDGFKKGLGQVLIVLRQA